MYYIHFYMQGAQKGREKIVEASTTQQNNQKSLNEDESKNY